MTLIALTGEPGTPCSSLDPSALDPEEIQRIRQVQVAMAIDPEQLAKGLANITVGEYLSSDETGCLN